MNPKNRWEGQNRCALKDKRLAHPNRGRECWRNSGTLCKGKQQGTPEEKKEFLLIVTSHKR
jgi:hypothetical protein